MRRRRAFRGCVNWWGRTVAGRSFVVFLYRESYSGCCSASCFMASAAPMRAATSTLKAIVDLIRKCAFIFAFIYSTRVLTTPGRSWFQASSASRLFFAGMDAISVAVAAFAFSSFAGCDLAWARRSASFEAPGGGKHIVPLNFLPLFSPSDVRVAREVDVDGLRGATDADSTKFRHFNVRL